MRLGSFFFNSQIHQGVQRQVQGGYRPRRTRRQQPPLVIEIARNAPQPAPKPPRSHWWTPRKRRPWVVMPPPQRLPLTEDQEMQELAIRAEQVRREQRERRPDRLSPRDDEVPF